MSSAHDTPPESISFVELLRRRAEEEPDKCLFAFLPEGEDDGSITLTRGDLDHRARALAARLQGVGLAGQRALLLYPPGLGFLEAFCGCLYAGVVAVPAYPPRVNRPMTRLQSIVADSQPSVVLTCASQRKDALRWEAGVPELRGMQRLITDGEGEDLDELSRHWSDPGARPDTLAFLQYTSGSTAIPKGAMITHGNLLANSSRIQRCFGATPMSRGVFWLPLFHDMGLIGGVIQTIYCGGASTLFSPVHFLHRPIRWLRAISRTRATISGAPNFAYELCVERTTPEERSGLDLSCWQVAFNGAETVRPETLDRFATAFAPAGFRREAYLPCYGLAEATLLVSGGPSGSPPVVISVDADALGRGEVARSSQAGQGKFLASSGEVACGHRVVIVDPSARIRCAENRIGEIWISGPSVAEGYWGRTAETHESLRASLSRAGEESFLRTGDLGFLKDGMLFVTGRIKDLIILRGRNVYPQDVEWTAERCHPALNAGGAAAFAIDVNGEERLAIVQEIKRRSDEVETEEVFAAIRQAITDQFEIEVHAIRLIRTLSLPKTSSGKVQRRLCRESFLSGSLELVAEWTQRDAAAPSQATKPSDPSERSHVATPIVPPSLDAIVAWLTERISGPLGIRPDEVDTRKPIASYGLGSLQAVRLASELEQWLGRKFPATLAYDYPTIDALAKVLSVGSSAEADKREVQPVRGMGREPIAIIGIGCRFPEANGPAEFWRLLRDGAEGVGPIPVSRWDSESFLGPDMPRRGGFLKNVDQFDADFFGISPREAVFVDPQHRLLLEVTWEAIEDGGQAPERLAGASVGVFVGISTNDYAQLQAMRGGASDGYRITGSAASIAANRISHHFDFRGPSLSIDTACSSSMVAVHLACKSLWDGECELAVAGGANLILAPEVFASFAKAGFLSPDGRCRAFDAQADGYVRGEGAGMVALKPLSRAKADGDPIYAVIRGGAVNQDGRTNGLTAPNRMAQEAVLRAAYRQAGVSPAQIDYVEAHGTGTLLGDPIELAALGAVLSEGRDLDQRCALGSVKTNIGHLEAAAGVAGLIKTAMALHHRRIPASLHFSQPNPHIAFDEILVRVQCETDDWPDRGRPSLAGVSSFGFGGTNAHLVLEAAPAGSTVDLVRDAGDVQDDVVVPLSARSPAALWDLALAIRTALSDPSHGMDLLDLAYTAGARRGHHDYRLALVVASRDEVVEALDAYRRGEPHLSCIEGRRLPGRRPRTVFVFSGEGGLWQGAGRALFDREPSFRAAIERCDMVLSRQLGWSPAAELRASRSSSRMGDSAVDQAVQFALQVALAALWKSWGIVPERSVGVGVGEVAAAHVAGILSLEDAATIIAGGQADAANAACWMSSMPRFTEALAGLAREGLQVFLEIGPHPILASAVKESLGPRRASALVLPSLRRGDAGLESLRWSAASLYAAGFDLEWARVSPPGRFVRLPCYPWQRERFWLDDADKQPCTCQVRTHDGKDGLESPAPHRNGKTNGHPWALVERHEAPVEIDSEPPRGFSTILPEIATAPSAGSRVRGPLGLLAEDHIDRLIEELRRRVADVLGMEAHKVDPDRPLLTMGLDSLSAVDLKVEVETSLGITLALSSLLEGATIRDLAEQAAAGGAGRSNEPFDPAVATLPEATPDPPAISTPLPGESSQPLSHGQQMLWYAHQFTRSGAAYHVTGAGSVRGALDIDAVRRAFRRVVARQEALRTTFAVVDEKPAVRLLDLDELARREDEWLPIEDVSGHGDAELQRKLTELSGRPFDLEKGPLFRVHVLNRSTTEHVFLLVFHHIIADFWSTAVFLDDFKTAYTAELEGRGTALPAPRGCFADFARWQQKMVESDEGERHWAYWSDQLAGTLPVLDLPTDFTRQPVQTYRGRVRHFYLDPTLTEAIVALSESREASLYTTLLAAFQVLLARFSGQHDIIVGTPAAGRTRPGQHDLVGYFVNLVPMRGDLSGNPPFDEFLGRVRRTVAEGLEHQDFPFSLLARRLLASPDPSRPPLFQAMFAHQKIQPLDEQGLAPFALGIPGARLNLHGLAIDSIAFERTTALFDLTMMTAREGDRLCVALEYSTDLFKAATIDRMAASFSRLLAAIVADPARRIADLSLLSEPERRQLLGEWAVLPEIRHGDLAIHHRFEQQVDNSPDAIALVFGEESLTYRELNRLSNSLAYRLIEMGVTPESVVGICLEQWPSRVIGLLGVLKAGAAYLPLDPEHPAERLMVMLRESGASLLLTEYELRDRVTAASVPILALNDPSSSLGLEDPGNPSVCVNPENLAYVIFTSGTTGRPKGVMVPHSALLAVGAAWESAYDLRRPPLRHLQAAGFGFDVFTGDWVRALTTGGTLVACPRPVLLDPPALSNLIRRERIECLELVPALADALAAHLERQGEDLEGVRLLAVGSDTVRRRLYRRLRRLLGRRGRVVNSYGLTETTIDSTYFGGALEDNENDGPVPIGRPLSGTRVYVLDEHLEAVPSGVLGDLYVGGSGVARGYAADPRQTAERFLPDPHGEPGSRIYATGDRARWCEGGVLELLGRRDGQVKVRGFRVELAEVESALARHPDVAESLVVPREGSNGETQLTAYVVPATVPGPATSDLRRWLKDQLPEPMIPSWFVSLDVMPLSPNGKVDRSALPSVTEDACAPQSEYVPPRTTAEELLAAIVAELVGRSRVGIQDNLFELGVDSILGIQIVSRARQANLALEATHLFRHPTIAELAIVAEAIDEPGESTDSSSRTVAPFELIPSGIDRDAIDRTYDGAGGIEDAYPLTSVQEGMLFHTLVDPHAGNYLEQFLCRVRGDLDLAALWESWQQLVERHPALRTTIHWSERDQPYQVVHRRALHPVDYQDWSELKSSEREQRLNDYIASDRRRSFVSDQPPLSRLALFRVGEDVHHLVWSIHHVVIDGWCLSLLLHEVLDIYEAIRRGCEPTPSPIRPFREYVAWLQHRDERGAESYWRRALSGVTAATSLGLESLASNGRTSREDSSERHIRLPAAVTTALQAVVRSGQLTLSTLIQGAWSVLLSRYSGAGDVLFGVTVSGRPPELPGVESIVGMFINVLPLRVEVTESSYLIPWLRKLHADVVELRRFETIPLSRIRTWSEIPPGKPLLESIVTFQNLPFITSLQQRADRLGIDSARYLEQTHYPIAVTVLPGAELEIKIAFDAHRFESATIDRILGHLSTLLHAIAADPERRITDLPWMTESEQDQMIGQSTPSQGEFDLHELDVNQLTEDELDSLICRLR